MGTPRDIRALQQRVYGRTYGYALSRIVYWDADFRCECGGRVFDKISEKKGIEHACVECGLHYMFVPRILKGATIF